MTEGGEVLGIGGREGVGVGFVDGVDAALVGHLDVIVTEDEGADGGIESEGEDAVAGGVDEDGGGAVENVTGSDLLVAGLEDGVDDGAGRAAEDGEDGADVDVDVDVGGAVEGVEDDDVFASGRGAVEDERLFVFFGDEGGDGVAQAEAVEESLVSVDVELLLGFAVDVGFAGGTDNVVAQAGAADFGFDHFGGEGEAGEKPGEAAAGFGVAAALLKHDVLLDGDDHACLDCTPGESVGRLGKTITSAPEHAKEDTAALLNHSL